MKKIFILLWLLLISGVVFSHVPSEVHGTTESSGYGTELIGSPLRLEPHVYPESIYNASAHATFFVWYEVVDGGEDEIWIKSYNHTTEAMSDPVFLGYNDGVEDDAHCAPTIGILSNGSLIAFYGSHSYVPGYITYRVSNGAYNVDSWFSEQTQAGNFSYPQAVSFSDTLKLFIRQSTASHDVEWHRYTFTPASFWADNTLIQDDIGPADAGGFYSLFTKETDGSILMSASLFNYTKGAYYRDALFYARSTDKGSTWAKADGTALSLPLTVTASLAINNTSTQSWFDGGFPYIGSDNKPRIMGIRGYQGSGAFHNRWNAPVEAIWSGSSWSADYIRNENNQIMNTTGLYADPSGYAIYPLRDADFNRTTFWYNTAPFNSSLATGYLARYVQSDTSRLYIKTLQTTMPQYYAISFAIQNHADPYEMYVYVNGGVEYGYLVWNQATFLYTFKGLYNEDTGLIYAAASRAVNVSVYFNDGTASEAFEVNGTYWYGSSNQPLYFNFNTSTPRQYYIELSDNGATIYVYDSSNSGSLIVYFNDLQGVLKDYPVVTIKRLVNGSLSTTQKPKVDAEKKINMTGISNAKYNLYFSSYSFGDFLFDTSVSSHTLTIKNVAIPQDIILQYAYVQVYQTRDNTSIVTNYNDERLSTTSVNVSIYYVANDTIAYTTTSALDAFVDTWSSANYATDYYGIVSVTHSEFGGLEYRAMLPSLFNTTYTSPFNLGFLWSSATIDTTVLLPSFIILGFALVFSQLNVEAGAFVVVAIAVVMVYLKWITITPGVIMTAMAMAIMIGLHTAKRRSHTE